MIALGIFLFMHDRHLSPCQHYETISPAIARHAMLAMLASAAIAGRSLPSQGLGQALHFLRRSRPLELAAKVSVRAL